ncbi:predicted protein [Botrytis cinerea T4]|uniref:Uncharacterized protein n=1 Tax=Botryotinia fuckeliana (strain T4) TaxID=999810 RepID=G2Y5W7_BOTF4|nr:predicted protein [Botrytis cinerea T4]
MGGFPALEPSVGIYVGGAIDPWGPYTVIHMSNTNIANVTSIHSNVKKVKLFKSSASSRASSNVAGGTTIGTSPPWYQSSTIARLRNVITLETLPRPLKKGGGYLWARLSSS